VVTWKDLGSLKAKLDEYTEVGKKIDDLNAKLIESLGPEPNWFWHPWDHKAWAEMKKNLETAKADIQKNLADLKLRRTKLVEETDGLARDPEKVMEIINSIAPYKLFWNDILSPILHLLFLLAILRYSASRILRLLLINGLIPATRL
jgi:hypothetical protein